MDAFEKRRPGAPARYYLREAEGLRWLGEVSGGAPVPDVLAIGSDSLTLRRITTVTPSATDARRFGAELAWTHHAGALAFGAPPPSDDKAPEGFIADLPLPYGTWDTFGPFYAQSRVTPYLQMLGPAVSCELAGVFDTLIEKLTYDDPTLTGPAEKPSRLHGDLWSGNVVWGPDNAGDTRGWLIDPAAHGGHRETDLAMLALFGAPHLPEIMAGYQSVAPLAQGWQRRVALHQIHPLLVHAVLFGGNYLRQAVAAAKTVIDHNE